MAPRGVKGGLSESASNGLNALCSRGESSPDAFEAPDYLASRECSRADTLTDGVVVMGVVENLPIRKHGDAARHIHYLTPFRRVTR
jgi:hypothetical protein